jgi:tRNA dimethylallyltransferase
MSQKHCIIIAGPTAVGKTAAAIETALALNTEILSADSRQCYQEMKIGVARPTEEELSAVKHHFIANHSITENITAASFAKEGNACLTEIFSRKNHAVVCGGTGLYIKALIDGLDDIPEIDEQYRKQVSSLYEQQGVDALRAALLKLDPDFANTGDINNPARMMRALEVVMATGKPIRIFQKATVMNDEERGYSVSYRILELPRGELYDRINSRIDKMVREGLEEEVRSLMPYRERPSLQTVGYQEFFDFFDGKCNREEAIEKIKQHTRNYAKRQITWFKKYVEGGVRG